MVFTSVDVVQMFSSKEKGKQCTKNLLVKKNLRFLDYSLN